MNAMENIGVDMFVDLHGDEALPYNFVAGCEGNPSYSDEIKALENTFKDALLNATPEFQDEFGYDKDAPGEGNLTVAANAVGEKFNCMSYTVEMPFKDNVDVPDEIYGWSVQRSRQLGEDLLIAVNAVVKKLNG
jgi:murein tripeptide amidase MpaA